MIAIDVSLAMSESQSDLFGRQISEFTIEVSLTDDIRMATAAVASWRWTDEVRSDPTRISKSIYELIKAALEQKVNYLFIDFVSIDQSDDELTQRVIEYSELYKTLPVVFGYKYTIRDEDIRIVSGSSTSRHDFSEFHETLQRAWISLEMTRYLDRLEIRNIFEFDNNATPYKNHAFLTNAVPALLSGFAIEPSPIGRVGASGFEVNKYFDSFDMLGTMPIKPDSYFLRDAVSLYTPLCSIARGISNRVDNCEYKTDLLVVTALGSESAVAKSVLERFAKVKIRNPCSALMLVAIAALSPRLKCDGCLGYGETLRAPKELARELVVGDLLHSSCTGFYLQYRSLRADVSTVTHGNIQFRSLNNSDTEQDLKLLIEDICSIGEMSDDDSVAVKEHAMKGQPQQDDHYLLALANAYM